MTHSKTPEPELPADIELDPALEVEIDLFTAGYDFPLDDFQLRAIRSIAAGHGVLVAAPTGSGKTIVGEFAVFRAFHTGGSCFYTTPIKALSNQKFHDLVARYGSDEVGLLTGDTVINGDAPIVVMTTEVLRNMIYSDSPRLANLTHVVMDEVHFLSDPSRGPVWEEAILNLDPAVTLVSLSATVSNVEEFGGWLNTVRGATDIIVSEKRPVPLNQFLMVGRQIMPLFDSGDEHLGSINRAVLAATGKAEEAGRRRRPKRSDVVRHLHAAGMLPAIYFIFSRAGCDGAVQQLLADHVDFTRPAEREEILRTVDAGVAELDPEDLKVLGFTHWRRALSRGFAAHHAGMLPAFRHIVEDLFTRGLLKVCFATETLALGINMPARTVVLEKLVKYNGEAHVELTPGQYTQLTGRAGRRGIDTKGNAVVLWQHGMDPYGVANLASTRTYPLNSTFRPGYNMAVNLIGTLGMEESHRLLQRSFAQYQADGSLVERAEHIEKLRRDVSYHEGALSQALSEEMASDRNSETLTPESAVELVVEYTELRRILAKEEREAQRSGRQHRDHEIVDLLQSLNVGDVIALPTGKNPLTAVVVRADNSRRFPRPTIITEDGWAEQINPDMFGNVPLVIGYMPLPKAVGRNPKRQARSVAANLRRLPVDKPRKLRSQARHGYSQRAQSLRESLSGHPVHRLPRREDIVRVAQHYLKAKRRLDYELAHGPAASADSLANQFDRIVDLLVELDYLERHEGSADVTVTEEGRRLADIHHESDLLVAQLLRRGIWDDLDPAELAGIASVCVFKSRRESNASRAIDMPTEPLAQSLERTLRVFTELEHDEQRYQVVHPTPLPETEFAISAHQWTAGAPLEYCLRAAEVQGATLTPGDFVRWCRQVIDLLGQIKTASYSDEVATSARKAIAAMRRGVVALDG